MSGPVFVGGMQLDLLVDIEPAARVSDIETSHQAAVDAALRAPNNRRRALLAFYEHGPQTDFGLAELTGIQQTSIGKRRLELERLLLVAPCHGMTRLSPSGSKSQVWHLTAAGEVAAKGLSR